MVPSAAWRGLTLCRVQKSVLTDSARNELGVDRTPLDFLKRLGELLSPEQVRLEACCFFCVPSLIVMLKKFIRVWNAHCKTAEFL